MKHVEYTIEKANVMEPCTRLGLYRVGYVLHIKMITGLEKGLDEICQRVKMEDAPDGSYKIGTKILINGCRDQYLYIEYRWPNNLNGSVIANRLSLITQSKSALIVNKIIVTFTIFSKPAAR